MRTRTPRQDPSAARKSVLNALAAGPYFSTVCRADELCIDPIQTRAIVDELDGDGLIRRDDGLAWTLTATGRLELQPPRRRPGVWRLLHARRSRPGIRHT